MTEPADSRFTVLVLCTGNSARSIMAEALFNSIGKAVFIAYSAGSKPAGEVKPLALEQIARLGESSAEFRSKHWREFAAEGAPPIDFVVTVCEAASGEVCPVFPGDFLHVCWELPDPAAATGDIDDARAAFSDCFDELKGRITALMEKPLDRMDKRSVFEVMQSLGSDACA